MRRMFAAAVCVLLAAPLATRADDQLRFSACATGAQVVPWLSTDGGAAAHIRFDAGLTHARVAVQLKNLPSEAAHFHCGRAGSDGPPAFSLVGQPNGPCEVIDDRIVCTLTSEHAILTSDCLTAIGHEVTNIAALRAAMEDGNIYLNLRTFDFPTGEARGQIMGINREGCFVGGGLLTGAGEGAVGAWPVVGEVGGIPQRRSPFKR